MSHGYLRKRWVLAACLGALVGFAVRNLAYYPLRVTSNSMSPIIVAGDWLVVSASRPVEQRSIGRGDIILFRFPPDGSDRAVKRVVAVSGDQVEAGSATVSVNGIPVITTLPDSAGFAAKRLPSMRIPEGFLYVLGDNAGSSIDSRSFGLLPVNEVVGIVSLVLKPVGWISALRKPGSLWETGNAGYATQPVLYSKPVMGLQLINPNKLYQPW
jgi:signal peptidase I